MSICLDCLGAGFCTVTFSTPLAISAAMSSGFTPSGSSTERGEAAKAALHKVIVLVFLLALAPLLAADGQKIVGYIQLDIFLLKAGQFGRELDNFIGLGHVQDRKSTRLNS